MNTSNEIVVDDDISEVELYKIEKFLESDWQPTEYTLEKWEKEGKKIIEFYKR